MNIEVGSLSHWGDAPELWSVITAMAKQLAGATITIIIRNTKNRSILELCRPELINLASFPGALLPVPSVRSQALFSPYRAPVLRRSSPRTERPFSGALLPVPSAWK